jgi:hypothetical protein
MGHNKIGMGQQDLANLGTATPQRGGPLCAAKERSSRTGPGEDRGRANEHHCSSLENAPLLRDHLDRITMAG